MQNSTVMLPSYQRRQGDAASLTSQQVDYLDHRLEVLRHKSSNALFLSGTEGTEHTLMALPTVHLDGAEGSRHDCSRERVERAERHFDRAVVDRFGERVKEVSMSTNRAITSPDRLAVRPSRMWFAILTRSSSVRRVAAIDIAHGSSRARACRTVSRSAGELSRITVAPRLGVTSASPNAAREGNASRTGTRETPKRSAISAATSRSPGHRVPSMISVASACTTRLTLSAGREGSELIEGTRPD